MKGLNMIKSIDLLKILSINFMAIAIMISPPKKSHASHVGIITPKVLHDSITRYHPKLVENLLKVSEAEGKAKASQGNFDYKISSKTSNRDMGYYTGDTTQVMLSKPISFLNSEVYSGYKKGTGTFPSYEGMNQTGEDGRYIFGGEINIFRNSQIYKNSVEATNAKMDTKKAEVLYNLYKVDLLNTAILKYYDWLAKGLKMQAYKSLLELANKRQENIEKQVKHGDIAKFYATENQQYILQRKNQVVQAENDFHVASFHLSLYLRNSSGKIVEITEKNLPKSFDATHISIELESDFKYAISVNPSIHAMDIGILQLKNELKIARAEGLPKLSLSGEVYQDLGNRTLEKQDKVGRFGVNFEMPLERRKGRGKTLEIEKKIEQVEQKKVMLKDTILTELQAIASTIQAYQTLWQNAENEFQIAQKLVEFERESVKHGNSNFFTLNLREQSEFQAQIKAIEFKSLLNKAAIEYLTIMMKLNEETLSG